MFGCLSVPYCCVVVLVLTWYCWMVVGCLLHFCVLRLIDFVCCFEVIVLYWFDVICLFNDVWVVMLGIWLFCYVAVVLLSWILFVVVLVICCVRLVVVYCCLFICFSWRLFWVGFDCVLLLFVCCGWVVSALWIWCVVFECLFLVWCFG